MRDIPGWKTNNGERQCSGQGRQQENAVPGGEEPGGRWHREEASLTSVRSVRMTAVRDEPGEVE